jgi:hypothetical protein
MWQRWFSVTQCVRDLQASGASVPYWEGLGVGAMALFVAQGGQSGVSVGSGVAAVQSEGAIGLAPAA